MSMTLAYAVWHNNFGRSFSLVHMKWFIWSGFQTAGWKLMAVTLKMSLSMKFILRNSLFFEGQNQIMTKIAAVSKQLQMPYHAVSIFLKPMVLWRIPPSLNFHGWKHILGHFYDRWCYIILGSVQGQLFPLLLWWIQLGTLIYDLPVIWSSGFMIFRLSNLANVWTAFSCISV